MSWAKKVKRPENLNYPPGQDQPVGRSRGPERDSQLQSYCRLYGGVSGWARYAGVGVGVAAGQAGW